jgi:antitoxin CptB
VKVDDLGRLRWRCRRGMLELDEALLAFLERHYPGAEPAVQEAFLELLDRDDGDVLALMTGNRPPETPAQARLLAMLSQPIPQAPG